MLAAAVSSMCALLGGHISRHHVGRHHLEESWASAVLVDGMSVGVDADGEIGAT